MRIQTTIMIILGVLAGLAILFYVVAQVGNDEDVSPDDDEQTEEPTEETDSETETEPTDSEEQQEETPSAGETSNSEDEDTVENNTASDESEEVTVTFSGSSYTPTELTIDQGDTVTWVNQSDQDMWPASNVHPTHEIYSEFDPRESVASGESWSFTFEEAGTWEFHDHLQPNLTGSVTVE